MCKKIFIQTFELCVQIPVKKVEHVTNFQMLLTLFNLDKRGEVKVGLHL